MWRAFDCLLGALFVIALAFAGSDGPAFPWPSLFGAGLLAVVALTAIWYDGRRPAAPLKTPAHGPVALSITGTSLQAPATGTGKVAAAPAACEPGKGAPQRSQK